MLVTCGMMVSACVLVTTGMMMYECICAMIVYECVLVTCGMMVSVCNRGMMVSVFVCVSMCVCMCVTVCVCVYLWYDGESAPQVVEPQGRDVHAVDEDPPLCCLDDPEQAVGETGLPCSGSTHDTNLWVCYITPGNY